MKKIDIIRLKNNSFRVRQDLTRRKNPIMTSKQPFKGWVIRFKNSFKIWLFLILDHRLDNRTNGNPYLSLN